MTRFFGSIGRMLKSSVAVVMLLVGSSSVMAEESHYKLRMHKNFIKRVVDKNFPVILDHIQNKVDKNVFLTEIDANIDDLSLKIQKDSGWQDLNSDVFFDQGQIVVEIQGLEYQGTGRITDPNTGRQDDIELKASMDLCQMVLTLEQELTDEGYIYPKIEITEVAF